MRSRNQRSCEMTSTLPAYSSSASSSARSVSTSRSFEGSSRSRTFAPGHERLREVEPPALAAGERPDDLLLIRALEVEAADVRAARHLVAADLDRGRGRRRARRRRSCRRTGSRGSGPRRRASPTGRRRPRRESGCSAPVIILNSVDLPAPFGPMMPTIAPGGTMNDRSSMSSRSPKPFETPLNSMTLSPSRSATGMKISCVSLRFWYSTDWTAPRSATRRALLFAWRAFGFWRTHSSSSFIALMRALSCFASTSSRCLLLLEPATSSSPSTGCRGRGRARGSTRPRCRGSSGRG